MIVKLHKLLLLLLMLNTVALQAQNCYNIGHSQLDASSSFHITNTTTGNYLGTSTDNLGDVNADGIDDIIIGAYGKEINGNTQAGESYVIFGKAGISLTSFDPETLNGTNGFKFVGSSANIRSGAKVSKAGDVNGDGINDILIGIPSYIATGTSYFGATVLIYGRNTAFPSEIKIEDIDGTNGVIFHGIDLQSHSDYFGSGVEPAGDINNDGFDDILFVGNSYVSGFRRGRVYVVYGSNALPAVLKMEDLNGTNGFYITGKNYEDGLGLNVSTAGDINADGFDDILIGMPNYDDTGLSNNGKTIVIFGKNTAFPLDFDIATLNGTNGFVISGAADGAEIGHEVSNAGDFNNDGIADLILTAKKVPQVDGVIKSEVYVFYGKNTGFSTTYDVFNLNINDGATIIGDFDSTWFGRDIAYAGDFNNDGIDDIIIGAGNGGVAYLGGAYVVYGQNGLWNELNFENINGINGVHFFRDNRNNYRLGSCVGTAGDFNADGSSDLLIGSSTVSSKAGEAYVVYGNTGSYVDNENPMLTCPTGETLFAGSLIPNYASKVAASDNCTFDKDLYFTQTPAPGTLFTGTTTVTISIKDKSGNTTDCSFIVTQEAPLPPVDCTVTRITANKLDGNNGTHFLGDTPAGIFGYSVNSAGDFNNDGINDIIVGAPGDRFSFDGPFNTWNTRINGKAYVIYGKTGGFQPNFLASELNGTNGFVINDGSQTNAVKELGYSVSTAGDINGDGFEDVMVSNPFERVGGDSEKGIIHVLFGEANMPSQINTNSINGTNGFSFVGTNSYDQTGKKITAIGDINNDGLDDIAIEASTSNGSKNGSVYVILGSNSAFPSQINQSFLNGARGFTVQGEVGSKLGVDIAKLGDVNGDFIDDFGLVSRNNKKIYVLFGKANFNAAFNASAITGAAGFTIDIPVSSTKYKVNTTGDINNDGINDIIVENKWVLFGRNSGFTNTIDVTTLNGNDGFTIDEDFNRTAPIGDFNNDGIDDVLLNSYSTSYVLFGKAGTWTALVDLSTLANDEMMRIDAGYRLNAIAGVGDLNNDGFADVLLGEEERYSSDYSFNTNPGNVYLINGFTVVDTTAPVITCPGNQTLALGNTIPDYTGLITVTDNCDTSPTLEQTPAIGAPYTPGATITIKAKDNSGNESTCDFTVNTSGDTLAPNITCPGDQNLGCEISSLPDYTTMATVTDDTDPNPIITQNPVAGSTILTTTVVTLTATDASGNTKDCTFIVNRPVDNVPPDLDCSISLPAVIGGVYPDYTTLFTYSDNCDPNPIITQTPAPGTTFDAALSLEIRVTDASGNYRFCTFSDSTAPIITCPVNQTVVCNITTIPDYRNLVSIIDFDPNPTVIQAPAVGSPFIEGMTVTITVTDAKGQASSCDFTVTTETDTLGPNITCIGNQELDLGDTLPDYTTMLTVTDNCDTTPTITQSPAAGSAFTPGMTVTITAEDASGNTNDCSFTVNLTPDNIAPIITSCPSDRSVPCTTNTVGDYRNLVVATDNRDAVLTISQSPVFGSAYTDGMTIIMTAADNAGNATDCSFTINTIADTEKPDITCLGNQELDLGDTLPDYTTMLTVTDNCDTTPTITQSPAAGVAFTPGMTITITAEDTSGNTNDCSFTVNLTPDNIAPIITSCPSDRNVPCTTTTVGDYRNLVVATDNRDAVLTISQSPAFGSAYTDGMTITMTATDNAGNATDCSFTINTIADTEKPDITCLGNQELDLGDTLPDYTTMLTVTDNCDTTPIVTQSPAAGAAFTPGMTITITAEDTSGNTNDCSFTVNLTPDNIAPIITSCPSDRNVACSTATVGDYRNLLVATDNRDAVLTISQSPTFGSAYTDGMTITMTATDNVGNATDCSFTINTIADTEKPDITCLGNQELDLGDTLPDYTTMLTVTDNCDTTPIVTQSPAAGAAFTPGMTITITAEDTSGNTNDCSFTVNLTPDNIAPIITSCPSDRNVPCTTTTVGDYRNLVVATDNRDAVLTISQSPAFGSAYTDGMTITMTATDNVGNATDCSFTINTIADTEKPDITCLGNQELDLGDTLPDYTTMLTVTDNCDTTPTITQNPAAGSAFTPGMTVTITAEDASGNTNDCSFMVNLISDTEAPSISCPSEFQVSCSDTVLPDFTSQITATDNRDTNLTVVQNPAEGTSLTTNTTVIFTVTDAAGNSTSCDVEVQFSAITIDAGTNETIIKGHSTSLSVIASENGTFEWSPAESLDDAFSTNPIASPQETTTYTVVFTGENGLCTITDEVTITVEEPTLNFGSGFSPNNDGINEYWKIEGIEEFPENIVSIYNRWGNKVFQINDYNNTSNKFTGEANQLTGLGAGKLPAGTYFYVIEIKKTHTLRNTKGFFVLKR